MGLSVKNRVASTQADLKGFMVRKPKSLSECAMMMDAINEYVQSVGGKIEKQYFKGKTLNYVVKSRPKPPNECAGPPK